MMQAPVTVQIERDYEELRPLLFSIAYRMLGSVSEAEDVVQEAFIRYQRALEERAQRIRSPKAYLSAAVTRLAIDHLDSARVRREHYVGEWQPEPVLTDETALEGERYVEQADSISMAFLLLLERLSPVERAVFLLHDVFDYSYEEVARIVGKSEVNCRQLAVRARRRVRDGAPRFEASREERERLADRFFAAFTGEGDVEDLIELLAADVVAYGDGGGKAPAARKAVHGRERVARLLGGLAEQARKLGVRARRTEINGQPGAVFLDSGDRVISITTLDIAEGQVQAVRSITNPEKLAHLGPPADLPELLRLLSTRR